MLRLLALLAAFLIPSPTIAQGVASPGTVRVQLHTSEGMIVVSLETRRAPLTAANFLRYVDGHRLDGAIFYRAMKLGPGSGLIQGGVRDPKLLLPPIKHESTAETGLSHVDGAIAMARYAPGSAQADFFIIAGAQPGFDAGPNAGGDKLGFAVFGRVVEGMDVVRRILAAPTSPTEGEGVMRGQMLSPPVRILAARRVD
jgi:peptidyl-prolyl cis-trans isomerase A (cyclophilin A)